jgi:hypothetical protein
MLSARGDRASATPADLWFDKSDEYLAQSAELFAALSRCCQTLHKRMRGALLHIVSLAFCLAEAQAWKRLIR